MTERNEGLRRHKLLTAELREQLPPLYSTEETPLAEKVLRIKFFSPYTNWTWYAVEGSQEGDDFLFFGYVEGLENEWGDFSLNELAAATVFGGVPAVERDLYWEPCTFAELQRRQPAAVHRPCPTCQDDPPAGWACPDCGLTREETNR